MEPFWEDGEGVVELPPSEPPAEELVAELKAELSATDYKCLKWMEGELTDDEYAPIKERRQGLRDRINELEGSLNV